MKCSACEDCGWVCENHPEKPWEGEHACRCGGAGMPCPTATQATTIARHRRRKVSEPYSTRGVGAISGRGLETFRSPRGRYLATCCRRTPPLSNYIPWLWNTFWQLLLSFVRFCCKH